MAGNASTPVPMLQTPLIDPRTGFCSVPWYQYFVSPKVANLDLSGATTDDLPQGEVNLYFTNSASFAATSSELAAGQNISISIDHVQEKITISAFGGTTVADTTAKVGLTRINGVLPTAMRSDAAPPLDQGISPTWTGTHTFNNLVKGTITYTDLFYLQAIR